MTRAHIASDESLRLDRLPDFDEFVISLGDTVDLAMPLAAARAGAYGILDLSFAPATAETAEMVSRFRDLGAGRRIGLLITGSRSDFEREILRNIQKCDALLLAPAVNVDVSLLVSRCRESASRIGVVVHSVEQAQRAWGLDVDFLVAKGHEAGGLVGDTTTFVLLQRLLPLSPVPVIAWGGMGVASAAACKVGGASGLVLDWQLALTRESPLDKSARRRIAAMDGSETMAIRLCETSFWRTYNQPGSAVVEELQRAAETMRGSQACKEACWEQLIRHTYSTARTVEPLLAVGQDACFAKAWSGEAATVARALQQLRRTIVTQVAKSSEAPALAPGSSLAQSHGTEFPIVQGPMTRVSDVPAFCHAVGSGGALPFLALALMRGDEVRRLLTETRDLMGDRPWGVGILGFVPRELREEQTRVIEEIRPKYAIIAGGRPDQAAALEAQGIATYLHVPSPNMLEAFLRDGARRFIFEGRECGGHVGPRTSFVLWESMIRVLLTEELTPAEAAQVHVLFAGGIHDGLSAAMVSAMCQPLVERGMKVGTVVGTGYLFTEEIVRTGAVVDMFQQVSLAADRTVLVETAPGHAIRCAPTEYTGLFEMEKIRLKREQRSAEEIRDELERTNMGRLRIASKGIARVARSQADGAQFSLLESDLQRREGMYMLGQVAALRQRTTTIRELHEEISVESTAWLKKLTGRRPAIEFIAAEPPPPPPLDVAIIGMGCLVPGALNIREFWQNVLDRRDAIGEIPPERFDYGRWFDSDRHARDRIYSKWGGFLPDLQFDPLRFGIPPASLASIEPMQLIALLLVEQTLRDAGYLESNPHKARTSVILGVGGGAAELGGHYALRSMLPRFFTETPDDLLSQLPEWTEDSFAGILLNVVAGRISNRFDLGGANYTVDAACASSLAAIYAACRDLAAGAADMVIAGGCDTIQSPFGYLCFSKTGALSPRGRSRAFDASADGIVISEGHAAIVLKRREDAERDGDRIYAIIKGVAGASDGRSMGLTAPRQDGQLRTLERAYAQARFPPRTVALFEAHGTGTAVGDQTECQALTTLLNRDQAAPRSVAIGGVKSMIGHTKCAAGVIGLVKAALALHHRVLPPTLHVEKPNPRGGLTDGPLYVNSELRPWFANGHPRRAGVSAFGFGGSNFHAVLEECGDASVSRVKSARRDWPAELFAFRSVSRERLARAVSSFAREIAGALERGANLSLSDLAYTLHVRQEKADGAHGVAIVAKNMADLQTQLAAMVDRLNDPQSTGVLRPGSFYGERPAAGPPPIAFLFPGQGSQFPNMLRDLVVEFQEMAGCFERADRAVGTVLGRPLSQLVFPPPAFTSEERAAAAEELKLTEYAQPALGACGVAMGRLLATFGVKPNLVAGHSFGELVALHAADCLSEDDLYRISLARGLAMRKAIESRPGGEAGTMLAVLADEPAVTRILQGRDHLWLANLNSPQQTVISGTREAIAQAAERFRSAGVETRMIPVACAFHSPLVADAREQYQQDLAAINFSAPQIPVYGNTTAQLYGANADEIRQRLAEQLVREVRFVDEVREMYAAGARIFVEVGPNRVLSRFVAETLEGQPHVSISTGGRGDDDLMQFLRALSELFAVGVPASLGRLYEGRELRVLTLSELPGTASPARHIWLVNGSYARPAHEPPRDATPRFVVRAIDESTSRANASPVQPTESSSANTQNPQRAGIAMSTSPTPSPTPPTPRTQPVERSRVNSELTGASGLSLAGEDVAYAEFQRTMRCFLETQEAVMRAYYGGQPVFHGAQELASIPSHHPGQSPISEAQPTHSPPAEMPSLEHQHPARNEVDQPPAPSSNSPIESFPVTTKPVVLNGELLQEALINVVSERTGYPGDMLDLHANMEAELGIDSIKRVEIIGAFRRQVLPAMGDPPSDFMEQMAAAKTMAEILAVVVRYLAMDNSAPVVEVETSVSKSAATAADTSMDEDNLLALLTNTVSQRTGYPVEMLDWDANLEGELGIDSIKRVEIISAFRRAAIPSMVEPPPEFMEQMTAAKTIRMILEVAVSFLRHQSSETPTLYGAPITGVNTTPTIKQSSAPPSSKLFESGEISEDDCPRCVAVAVETPYCGDQAFPFSSGVFVVTDDGEGLAEQLVGELESLGGRGVILNTAALSSAATTMAAVDSVRQAYGRIQGVVHLLPLSAAPRFPGIEPSDWETFRQREVLGLFYLVQAVGPELQDSESKSVGVISVSRGGGDFMTADADECLHPWRGGLAGLLKVAQREWPEAVFRAIDVDASPSALSVLQELQDRSFVEIGYRRGRRLSIQAIRQEIVGRAPANPQTGLSSDSVVLVTGGARGITAEVADELAAKTHATFVLLGRSPLPMGEEDAETAALSDPVALRRAMVAIFQERQIKPAPKEVEDALRSLLAAREIRKTLAGLRRAGARVEYIACDVRDAAALTELVRDVQRRLGPIDAVVHGAGIIEDRLIIDKTTESFERVTQTKLQPLLTLCRILDPQQLKLLMLFSSTSGFFGNPGQCDYASANEILNRIARRLDDLWPAKVVTMNWGPWSGAGMVTPEVARQFQQRGVGMVTVSAGRKAAWREAERCHDEGVRIVVGPGAWIANADQLSVRHPRTEFEASTPLLAGSIVRQFANGRLEVEVELQQELPYLNDHRIDGKPVLPLAIATAMMAELARAAAPAAIVSQIAELRQFQGIILDSPSVRIRISGEPLDADSRWRVRIADSRLPLRTLYQAEVQLAADYPPAPSASHLGAINGGFPKSVEEAYLTWMFHDRTFWLIDEFHGIDRQRIDATIRPSCPRDAIGEHVTCEWTIDGVALDVAPQMIGFWSRARFDITPLPNRIASLQCFGSLAGEPLRCIVQLRQESNGGENIADVYYVRDGKIVVQLAGLEAVGSAELNRITGVLAP